MLLISNWCHKQQDWIQEGKNNGLTTVCDFTWSYSNYFCGHRDLSFFILGGSHRKVVLNEEGTASKKANGWSHSISSPLHIMNVNIADKLCIHNLLSHSIILELNSFILSIGYVQVWFSSKKCLLFSVYSHVQSAFVLFQNTRNNTAWSETASGQIIPTSTF